ncbi:uncharacterized conserved protein YndB, AHSA1/START domain [Bacteroidales bacterium 6E]|nr:uncharacterized conserved protein YndB, AHSA1/START domain [Bacteroidales bacterium 6E]
MKSRISVNARINAPVEKVWYVMTDPQHIVGWNAASEDWHCPTAENNLIEGGRFVYRMAARDGSMEFDFSGTYDKVIDYQIIEYTLDDERKVTVTFQPDGLNTFIIQAFEPETTFPEDLQRDGWQAILDNFKRYVENLPVLSYSIEIEASADKVFKTMLDDDQYRRWTTVFNPTSRFEGKWQKGESIKFLGSDEQGNVGGMQSLVREFIPNRFISLQHIGEIQTGVNNENVQNTESWSGALENYWYFPSNKVTMVYVETDRFPGFDEYFNDTWPKALAILKKICEEQFS